MAYSAVRVDLGKRSTFSAVYAVTEGDGIAGRGPSYGMPAVRVDGGDARAVYNATRRARDIALEHSCPVLIEVRAAPATCLIGDSLLKLEGSSS